MRCTPARRHQCVVEDSGQGARVDHIAERVDPDLGRAQSDGAECPALRHVDPGDRGWCGAPPGSRDRGLRARVGSPTTARAAGAREPGRGGDREDVDGKRRPGQGQRKRRAHRPRPDDRDPGPAAASTGVIPFRWAGEGVRVVPDDGSGGRAPGGGHAIASGGRATRPPKRCRRAPPARPPRLGAAAVNTSGASRVTRTSSSMRTLDAPPLARHVPLATPDVDARLDGGDHARLQHPPFPFDLVIPHVVHVHAQPVAGPVEEELPVALLLDDGPRPPLQQAEIEQASGDDLHRRVMRVVAGVAGAYLVDGRLLRRQHQLVDWRAARARSARPPERCG